MVKDIPVLQVAHLRKAGVEPRVHGNGFVQLDVADRTRLHIWGHPDIPRQSVNTSVHNHRFSFVSSVLVGEVSNNHWNLEPIESHNASELDQYLTDHDFIAQLHQAVCRDKEDTILTPTGEFAHMSLTRNEIVDVGSCYFFTAGEFHEIQVIRPSATLCFKMEIHNDIIPVVAVEFEEEPDNDFNRYSFSSDDLWGIIKDVMKEGCDL